jgi:hypothetical protein
MYMPPLGLLCSGLIIKAYALWLKMQKDPTKLKSAEEEKGEEAEEVKGEPSHHEEEVSALNVPGH